MLVRILSKHGFLLALSLPLGGCGGAALRAQVQDLKQQVAELSERHQEALRRCACSDSHGQSLPTSRYA